MWEERWRGLAAMIDETEAVLPSGFDQEPAVRAMLRTLRVFGASQLRYFLTHPSPLAREFPETMVLEHTLTQIARDLELIERLAHQRAWGSLAGPRALAWADPWLTRRLRAADPWLAERDRVLAVLSGTPSLTHLPYLGTLSIGVPYTGVRLPDGALPAREWLGLLPELGRHVFRRGQEGDQPIADAVAARAGALSTCSAGWAETVFAEVFACLSAGPAAALAAQEAALALPPAQFNLAGPASLPPVLIPKIHTRVLERLCLDDWAESLGRRWATRLQQRGAPASVRLSAPITELQLVHPRDELYALADAAYDGLRARAAGPLEGWHARYTRLAAYPPHALETLYSDFGADLAQAHWDADCAAEPAALALRVDWPAQFIAADRRARETWAPAGLAHDIHDWLAVLRAGGWLTLPV